VPGKLFEQSLVAGGHRGPPGQDDYVDRAETGPGKIMQSKAFPNDTFEAVALYGPAVNLPRNGHSEARTRLAGIASEYLEAGIGGNHRLLEHVGKCFFSGQTATPLKSHAGITPGGTRYR